MCVCVCVCDCHTPIPCTGLVHMCLRICSWEIGRRQSNKNTTQIKPASPGASSPGFKPLSTSNLLCDLLPVIMWSLCTSASSPVQWGYLLHQVGWMTQDTRCKQGLSTRQGHGEGHVSPGLSSRSPWTPRFWTSILPPSSTSVPKSDRGCS